MRFTKRCASHETCTWPQSAKALRLPQILPSWLTSFHKRGTSTNKFDNRAFARYSSKNPKGATCPTFMIHCTCHENSTPNTNAKPKALHLPRNLQIEVQPSRSPATKSRLRTTKTRRFPCACHKKWCSRGKCPLQPTRLREPPALEVHFENLERHECAANSLELAGHTGEHPQSSPALTTTVRTPSVTTKKKHLS